MWWQYLLIISSFIILSLLFVKHYNLAKKDLKFEKDLEKKICTEEKQENEPAEVQDPANFKREILQEERKRCYNLSDVNRIFEKADEMVEACNLEEAEKLFIKVLSMIPDHEGANNKLGVLYLKQENYKKAEIIYKNIIKKVKINPVFYSNLALSCYHQKKFDEAIMYYEKAIKLDASRSARYISLGQIYFELNEFAKALPNFLKAYSFEINNVELIFIIADLYKRIGKLKEAKDYFEKVLFYEPENPEARMALSKLPAIN